jgi:hypothetical protein
MLTLHIPTGRDFWKAIFLFAYRRWAIPGEKKPVGIPGNRDPDYPCSGYEPVPIELARQLSFNSGNPFWQDCQTDGHYLCAECCHRAPTKEYAEEDCPGHVASELDPKICGRCGVHIDDLRPPDDDEGNYSEFPEAR